MSDYTDYSDYSDADYSDYSDYSSGSASASSPKKAPQKVKKAPSKSPVRKVEQKIESREIRKAMAPAKEHHFHNKDYSGRRKALLVGINYVGQGKAELSGCVNDVTMAKHRLEKLHFQEFNVLLEGTASEPTKANIKAGFKWLVNGARPGDVLFVHFSGHGVQVRDKDGDETDGMDEAICPVDYKTKGVILDDWIRSDVVDVLPSGSTLYAVFDCCHSGTMTDTAYIYNETSREFVHDKKRKATSCELIVITGCKSSQKSADLPPGMVEEADGAQGALSSALYPMMHKRMSWADLIAVLRYRMQFSKLEQVPQLESGRPHNASDIAFRRILKDKDQQKSAKRPPAQPPVKKGSGKPPGTCSMVAFAVIGLCVAFSAAAIQAAENNGVKSSRLTDLFGDDGGENLDDGGPPLVLATPEDEVV